MLDLKNKKVLELPYFLPIVKKNLHKLLLGGIINFSNKTSSFFESNRVASGLVIKKSSGPIIFDELADELPI